MTPQEIDKLATMLFEGRRARKPMDVAGAMADLSEADSYRV